MSTTASSITSYELTNRSAGQPATLVEQTSTQDEDTLTLAQQNDDASIPEGGYGWVVIASCCVCAFWQIGTPYSWGVMQSALVEAGVSSPAILAFVGSLTICFIAMMAVFNSVVMRRFGSRLIGMSGIILMSLSELLSSFLVDNIGALFASNGVVMGIGCSLCFSAITVVPGQYFRLKRGLAFGIVFAAGGLGGATISFCADALIQRLGIAWAYRVLALVTLITGLPAAYFIKERVPYTRGGVVDWKLFKSFSFVFIFLTGVIGTFPLLVPPYFLPLFAKSIGFSTSYGAGLVAGFNLSSAIGRILCGILCDRIGALNVLFISLIMSGMTMLALWPIATSSGSLIAFVVLNGMANGGFFSTMPTVVGNVFGSRRVAVAMGMVVTGWAGGYLMGAPIAGYLLDAYGGTDEGLKAYQPAMFYAGSLAMAAAGSVAAVRLRIGRKLVAKI